MSGSRLHTASEVARHCTEADCWVSVFGRVYDLTPLLAEGHGTLADPIIDAAGTDVSHWFDRNSGDVRAQHRLGDAGGAMCISRAGAC
jgi:cytochrome b involved in lipid metabolism